MWNKNYENTKHYLEKTKDFTIAEKNSLKTWISKQRRAYIFGNLVIDRIRLLEKINNWIWDTSKETKDWNEYYAELKSYADKNNILPSRKSSQELSSWIYHQRSKYKKGLLEKEKVNLLEELSCWYWDKKEEELKKWHYNYSKLKEALKIGVLYSELDKFLSSWTSKQREEYKLGRLDQNKIKLLEDLENWYWQYEKYVQDLWEYNFEQLRFKIDKGVLYSELNNEIKTWIYRQRSYFTKKKLDPEKQIKLESLNNWYWDTVYSNWIENYNKYKNLKAEDISKDKIDDVTIKSWIYKNRAAYMNDVLEESKIKLLEALPSWEWDTSSQKLWEQRYEEIKEYLKENGKYPKSYPKGSKNVTLNFWIRYQKDFYKKGKLNDKRVEKLSILPNWSWEN